MKSKKEADKPKDELSQRLQESLRKRRPNRTRIVVIALGLAAGSLGLMAWWLYPQPPPARRVVVAFDQVGVPGNEVVLSGRLAVAPGATGTTALKDVELIFEEGKLTVKPGEQLKQVVVKTGGQGEASLPWSFPAEATEGDFIVRHVGTKESPGTQDWGRVALWPKESKLVLVQIEQTLTAADEQAWQHTHILDIPPAPGAAEALDSLQAAKYRIAYLAVGVENPLRYQKMRAWVKHHTNAGPTRFPVGPVLAAATTKAQFVGPHIAITGTTGAAQQMHAAGYAVYFLGQSRDLPKETQRVPSWTELRKLLIK